MADIIGCFAGGLSVLDVAWYGSLVSGRVNRRGLLAKHLINLFLPGEIPNRAVGVECGEGGRERVVISFVSCLDVVQYLLHVLVLSDYFCCPLSSFLGLQIVSSCITRSICLPRRSNPAIMLPRL